ncbi:hypothetical protein QUB19_01115 [Microcoleus sp. B4-C5]
MIRLIGIIRSYKITVKDTQMLEHCDRTECLDLQPYSQESAKDELKTGFLVA